jgi:hypothetical protein
MRRTLIVLVFQFIATSAFARSGFSGVYHVTGTNPGAAGERYQGTLTISSRGDAYELHWAIANDEFHGVGIVVNNTLCVAYTAGDRVGVVGYRQRSDGSLEARWTVEGLEQLGTELAERQ